ncbi:hypothetical protein Pve01_26000 [Planomonospora venezuelensis]|nr:hypothetical protein Pve01_26000 [Planomonospora venezuelensis]
MFTEVGGGDCGGGAVAGAQPAPPGVETGWEVGADADIAQAVTRTAAQKVLIMAASVAGSGLHGRERDG